MNHLRLQGPARHRAGLFSRFEDVDWLDVRFAPGGYAGPIP
jgi:hypothetical protein